METSRAEGKRSLNYKKEEEEEEGQEEEDDEEMSELGFGEDVRRKRMMKTDLYSKRGSKPGGSSMPPSCQVDGCDTDLSNVKQYHRRHKVCECHSKSSAVPVAGLQQRFCQQCSRFHELSEFDDSKRSCRRRLAGHNERRRKIASDYHGEGFHQ